MKINLLKGSITYGAVTIFSRVAAVFLIPVLTRILSPAEYGLLNMVLTIVILANLVATFEIVQAVTLYFNDTKRTNRDLYPATAIKFSFIMYTVFFILAVVAGGSFLKISHQNETRTAIVIYGTLLLAVNGFFLFIQNQLRLEFKTKEYALVTITYVLLTNGGAIAGALLYRHMAEGVILGQVAGALITDVAGIYILRRIVTAGFSKTRLREMLKLSLPLVPAGLLLLGGQQASKFILSSCGTMEDVGIYGLAYQIAGFSALAVLGVQTAITPSVLANHEAPETPRILGQLFERFAVVALLFCTFLSIFAGELVMIFSTSGYKNAASYVPPLAFAVALSNLYIFFPGKIIRGKSASQLIASIISFLVAVIGGYFLTKLDGIRGASFATLLSAASFFFTWCYISQKLYHLPVNWFKLLKAALLTTAMCIAGLFLMPEKIDAGIILVKSALMALFTCVIAWEYVIMAWEYVLKIVKR